MEHIIAAAIKYDNRIWQLPRPKRHHDVMRSIGGMFGPHVEGFISSTGEFVNRTEAMRIAVCDNDAAGIRLAKYTTAGIVVPEGDLGSATQDFVDYLCTLYK